LGYLNRALTLLAASESQQVHHHAPAIVAAGQHKHIAVAIVSAQGFVANTAGELYTIRDPEFVCEFPVMREV